MSDKNKFGWIANEVDRRSCRAKGIAAAIDAVHDLVCPWDGTDQPTIVTYADYSAHLAALADEADLLREVGLYRNWWERQAYKDGLLIDSQGSIGSCAGVSYYDRCYITTLVNQIGNGSEQSVEPVNALASWLISKGGSRSGGQTIAAVVQYGSELGVYPAALVGEYDASSRYDSGWRRFDSEANKRQMGACLLEDSNGWSLDAGDMADAILLACRAGKTVEIGQSIGVRSGRTMDSNGVSVVQLAGGWAHATAFSGWKIVNGAEYAYWINSHGRLYESNDGSPAIGGWMSKDTVKRFCSSNYCDAAICTYVESPHGKDNLNLNPVEALDE